VNILYKIYICFIQYLSHQKETYVNDSIKSILKMEVYHEKHESAGDKNSKNSYTVATVSV